MPNKETVEAGLLNLCTLGLGRHTRVQLVVRKMQELSAVAGRWQRSPNLGKRSDERSHDSVEGPVHTAHSSCYRYVANRGLS